MEQMFRRTAQQIMEQFGVTAEGLSQQQVEKQRQTYGENVLAEEKKKSALVVFLEQFKDLLVIILIAAAVISPRSCVTGAGWRFLPAKSSPAISSSSRQATLW